MTNPAGSDNLPLYVDVGFEKYQRSELAEGVAAAYTAPLYT